MTSLKAALLVAAASVAFTAFPSDAADYPARPVRIIVGFAAGGAPDTLARVVGDKLAQDWGSRSWSRTGQERRAISRWPRSQEPPDGYTLALVPVGNAAVNPSLIPDLPYDMKQFAPVTQIANVENVLVVSAKSP